MQSLEAPGRRWCYLDDKWHDQGPKSSFEDSSLSFPLISSTAVLPSKAWNSQIISRISPQIKVGILNKGHKKRVGGWHMMLENKYWETSTILNNSFSGLIWWISKAKNTLFVLSVIGLSQMFTILSPDLFYLLPFHIEINTEKAKRCTRHSVVCSALPGLYLMRLGPALSTS